MAVRLYPSPTAFLPVARLVYRTDPVRYTSELTALRTAGDDGVFLSVLDGVGVVGAALQTPGDALLVSGLDPAMTKQAVAAFGSAAGGRLPAVRGTSAATTAFVHEWRESGRGDPRSSTARTLYRLGDLHPPTDVAGAGGLAGPADDDTVLEWLDGFFADAFAAAPDPPARRRYLDGIRAAGGDVLLWTVDGTAVSMARVHAPAAGVSRIGPVYTPPEARGRGFGAAVTAAACAQAFRRGARDVVLYADHANPGANRIYRRLGFHAVAETIEYRY